MELTCHNVSCSIGARVIVSGIDLHVQAGTSLALVGINGSGKSTLIRSLVGLSKPTRGTVEIDGQNVSRLSQRNLAKMVAYVPQEGTPPADLLVGEMVAMGRIPHRPPWALSERHERAITIDALATVGMSDFIDRPCNQLSGGERRRAMLARGLAQGCRLLIVDEPTNHLDVHHQISLLRTLCGLGHTVVAAIHDLALAGAFFDRVAVLHEGRLRIVGTPVDALSPEIIAEVFDVAAARVTDPATGRQHLVFGPGSGPPRS